MSIFETYISSLQAVSQIYIIIIISFLFRRKGMISKDGVGTIAKVSTYLFLPSLIFSKNIAGFLPDKYPWWWMVTLWSIVILLIGIAITRLLFLNKGASFRDRLPMGAMQNSGYFVLPIGMILFPDRFDIFSSFVFLAVLGVSPTIWSFGRWLLTPNSKFSFKGLITPPFAANILSISLVLMGGRDYIPSTLLTPMELLGAAAIPTGLFVLGANLAEIDFKGLPPLINLVKVNLVKFILIPIITIAAVLLTGIVENEMLRFVLLIESCSPPAVALMLIANTYNGDSKMVSSYIIVGYLLALIFVPIWLTVFMNIA